MHPEARLLILNGLVATSVVACSGGNGNVVEAPADAGIMGAAEAANNAQDDMLGWSGGQGDAGWNQCAELAPLDVPTFADAKASPGGSFRMKARVRANHEAAVPLWLWQPSRVQPDPVALTPTSIDSGWSMVSFPMESTGTYRVVVHTHYPSTDACGAELEFDAR